MRMLHPIGTRHCINEGVPATRFGRTAPALFQPCPTHSHTLLTSLQRDWLALLECQPCGPTVGPPNPSGIASRNTSPWPITPALLSATRRPPEDAQHRRNRWGSPASAPPAFPARDATSCICGRADCELAVLWRRTRHAGPGPRSVVQLRGLPPLVLRPGGRLGPERM